MAEGTKRPRSELGAATAKVAALERRIAKQEDLRSQLRAARAEVARLCGIEADPNGDAGEE